MIQRVCDGCEQPVPNGVEHVEIFVEQAGDKYGNPGVRTREDLHDECVNVGERVARFYDEGAVKVEVTRKKW